MYLEFIGAADGVTGSRHLLHTGDKRILLDCGLFQGRRQQSIERNQDLGFRPHSIDAVVLSHAHIDHSGALPLLYRKGYRGPVYTTPATHDLCAAMLEDSANIQESDARYIKNLIVREHREDIELVKPLYDSADVAHLLGQMVGIPYRHKQRIAEGVDLTFYDAGHVLGSAIVALDLDADGERRRLVFTGDLGRRRMPILRDPEIPTGASFLLMESTYGDRVHADIEQMDEELERVVKRTYARGGKVIIPSFALERAQELIFAFHRLKRMKRLPNMNVYVDSPLTLRVTDVFRLHPECFDEEAREQVVGDDSPFDFDGLIYVSSVDDSKQIDRSDEPCVVISASGMCEFGRVLHHLRASVGDPKSTVVIVGFQAQHTLGRRLVEGRKRVRIFGVERERRCEVVVLDGFSAHADRDDLLDFAEAVREKGPLRQVALVHGEDKAREALRERLLDAHFPTVHIPRPGERIEL